MIFEKTPSRILCQEMFSYWTETDNRQVPLEFGISIWAISTVKSVGYPRLSVDAGQARDYDRASLNLVTNHPHDFAKESRLHECIISLHSF
jgi:DNA-directed RNA polymerase alpha subunit